MSLRGPVDRAPVMLLVALALASATLPAGRSAAQGLSDGRRIAIASRLRESVVVVTCGPSTGSGFVVGPERWVVTNAHVVEGFEQHGVAVQREEGRPRRGRVLAVDRRHDLAVVVSDGLGAVRPLALAPLGSVRVGQTVLAFGSPFGLEGTLTQGIVSALRDMPDNVDGTIEGMIQTDAPINPGNSGGPLVNTRGQVIGVNTGILSRSGGNLGIGFAVPSRYVAALLDEVRTRVRAAGAEVAATPSDPPWLGIVASDFAVAGLEGVQVERVVPSGPADRAGLRGRLDEAPSAALRPEWSGHVIVAVDEHRVRSFEELETVLAAHHAGDRVALDVIVVRARTRSRVVVRLGQPPGESVR